MRFLIVIFGVVSANCAFGQPPAGQPARLPAQSEKQPGDAGTKQPATAKPSPLLSPDAPEMNRRAPDVFRVRFETTKGVILFELRREWAPIGVDRFYNLVRHGYYDSVKFHRISAGNWAQFGINGEPKISQAWRNKKIKDDPFKESNVRGTLAYAFAEKDGRTTQLFISLKDNSATHDTEPFVPIGRVVEGMDVADKLYAEYGEQAGGGIRGGQQGVLFEQGNAWLEKNFPRLDAIKKATIEGAAIEGLGGQTDSMRPNEGGGDK
jgi:cyclophilin family peptidyl-prolyl cis-trans isomerase